MGMKPIKYPYSTSLVWTGEHKGNLSCSDKPDIHVACPPEWGGHPNIWSPEDLFVGSVEVCAMTTFLWLAEREGIRLRSYRSEANATAQMINGEFGFPSVEVRLWITLFSVDDLPKTEQAVEEIGEWCLISKSLKPKVNIIHEITVESDDKGSIFKAV